MCGPPSVRLDKPVILSFPHCAIVKHGHWSLSLFTSHSGFDEPPAWHVRPTYLLFICRVASVAAADVRIRRFLLNWLKFSHEAHTKPKGNQAYMLSLSNKLLLEVITC